MRAKVDVGTPVAIYWVKKGANMKKTELTIGTATPQSFKLLYISLTLVFIFIVSGCITPYALDLAEEKSSPSVRYTDWNLKKIRSAVEQENGDISVFAELYESHKRNKSECYAITLPNSSMLKETTDLETLGFRGMLKETTDLEMVDFRGKEMVGHPDSYGPGPYIDDYLYPLAKAKKGCQKLEPKKLPADSILPIVKVTLPEKDRYQLYNILNELKQQGSQKEKLYEVKFLTMEEDSSVEMNENEDTNYSDVLLIYWPSGMDQDSVQPLGIAGGYESEDESTKLYYLLIPPAVTLDLILLGLCGGRV